MDFLTVSFLDKPIWMWLLFLAIIIGLLALDLGVLHRRHREISVSESVRMAMVYIAIGLLFGGWIAGEMGQEAGLAYLAGFLVEKTLALDNVFVIAMIFGFFGIPRRYQHEGLFWGIIGVIVLRAIMIGLGAALVTNVSWALYLFGVILIFTGIRMLMAVDKPNNIGGSRLLALLKRRLRVIDDVECDHFFVRQPVAPGGRPVLHATPLFLALVMIEIADIIFAVDSIPAIFAITTDTYIVYTSNIFAVLGLRAIYFALAAAVHRFYYLKYALSAVLIFIGAKIFLPDLIGIEKLPPLLSLGVTVGLLGAGVVVSLWRTRGGGMPASAQ